MAGYSTSPSITTCSRSSSRPTTDVHGFSPRSSQSALIAATRFSFSVCVNALCDLTHLIGGPRHYRDGGWLQRRRPMGRDFSQCTCEEDVLCQRDGIVMG